MSTITEATKSVSLPQLPDIDRSAIAWCGPTWNPWQGCIKVSAGCKNCYMYRDKKRYGKDPSKVVRSAKATFDKPLKWQREVERGIRTGNDRLVFTCSWSDWFIDEADGWRDEAWAVIRRCPGLIFQILTKRADRIIDQLPEFWDEIKDRCWMGVSCENQDAADKRIPYLMEARAGVKFLSCEPLLGPIDLTQISRPATYDDWTYIDNCLTGFRATKGGGHTDPEDAVKWVITGDESGPDRRETKVEWTRDIKDQCAHAGVAYFNKQMFINGKMRHELSEFPEDLRVQQFPSLHPPKS